MRDTLYDGNLQSLQQAPILGRLKEADLAPLAVVAVCRRYDRGQQIEPLGRDDDGLFVIVRGGVRLYLLSPLGRELTLVRRRCGDVFELGGVDPALPDETMAEALSDATVVCALPWMRFLEVVSSHPAAASSLATLLRRRRAEERALLREFAFYSMKARLAHKVADLARSQGRHVVTETHEALGSMIGSRQEAVTKALHQLRAEGLIDFRRHHPRQIALLEPDRLAAYGSCTEEQAQ